jgi:deazaflavin-dependent oxidoreductase (nitroreductase family)
LSEPIHYARPGFLMRRLIGPLMVKTGTFPVLTVVGRTSGKPRRVPLGEPIEIEGRRYLVSARGQTHWSRNLRAARRGTLAYGSQIEGFRAVEVAGAERDQVIAAYRKSVGKVVDRAFTRFPYTDDHPTFRMEPEAEQEPDTDAAPETDAEVAGTTAARLTTRRGRASARPARRPSAK